jgi:hypothetical protein
MQDRKDNNMKLRWHQTYNRFGNDSEPVLQYCNNDNAEFDDEWEDVEFVREFDGDYDKEAKNE